MINPKTGKSIGRSFLPSSDPYILEPIGAYKIEPDFDRDTFVLKRGGVFVAEHPNAYSLHSLVKRIEKGNSSLSVAEKSILRKFPLD